MNFKEKKLTTKIAKKFRKDRKGLFYNNLL